MLYYINEKSENNNHINSLKKAFDFFKGKNFNLAMHNKNGLTGILEKIVNQEICNELKKRNFYTSYTGNIGLITEKIHPIYPNYPIIAYFITKNYLEKLISSYSDVDIIYIPWTQEEIEWVSNNKNFKKI